MSTNSGADDSSDLSKHTERVCSGNLQLQPDADGRIFYNGEFVSVTANKNRSWRWKLLRTGDSLFNICIEPLSDRSITLRSVRVFDIDGHTGAEVSLTGQQNIGQPIYQSDDFSVANSRPSFDEVFRCNDGYGIRLVIYLEWTESAVDAAAIPISPDRVLESQLTKVMVGGDLVYELVSSDGQSFSINVTILQAKSAYFLGKFWPLKTDGRCLLPWTSAVLEQMICYIYLNKVNGDVCELLPDILDAAQMWELVGMKPLIEAQMKVKLQKAARDADTDTAAEYLKMAHLHSLTSLVPICNKVLADNYDRFFDSDSCEQMFNSSEFRHLIKALFHHKCNTHN